MSLNPTALKQKPQLKMFHAIMLVTRAEEWCVEAETPEEARELLGAGRGHRCHLCMLKSTASRTEQWQLTGGGVDSQSDRSSKIVVSPCHYASRNARIVPRYQGVFGSHCA